MKPNNDYPGLADIQREFFDRTKGMEEEASLAEVQQMIDEYKNKDLQRGEGPDTWAVIQVEFEKLGIPPAGWNSITPYDTKKYPLTQVGMSRLFADWNRGKTVV